MVLILKDSWLSFCFIVFKCKLGGNCLRINIENISGGYKLWLNYVDLLIIYVMLEGNFSFFFFISN